MDQDGNPDTDGPVMVAGTRMATMPKLGHRF